MANDILRNWLAAIDAIPTDAYPRVISLLGGFTRVGQMATGIAAGTGASLAIATPGDPRMVVVANTTNAVVGLKFYGMATDVALKINSTGPAISYAAAMVTLGTDMFTLGNDAGINSNLDNIVWFAGW